jgi:hypothetical protein
VATLSCPFHVECQFPKSSMKTPSEAMLMQFYCLGHFEDCEILQRKLTDLPVPTGVCPDETIKQSTYSSANPASQTEYRRREALLNGGHQSQTQGLQGTGI